MRAYDGQMNKRKVSRAITEEILMLDERKQVHVMHIDSNKFLITVCEPLHLVIEPAMQ